MSENEAIKALDEASPWCDSRFTERSGEMAAQWLQANPAVLLALLPGVSEALAQRRAAAALVSQAQAALGPRGDWPINPDADFGRRLMDLNKAQVEHSAATQALLRALDAAVPA